MVFMKTKKDYAPDEPVRFRLVIRFTSSSNRVIRFDCCLNSYATSEVIAI